MRRFPLLVAIVALPLFACADGDPAAPPFSPTATFSTVPILDGAHNGGNPHFFFLAPLVKDATFSGVFNPDLHPIVEVCALDATGECADPQPAGFPLRLTTGGQGPTAIRVDADDEHYAVNLQTRRYALDPAVNYRIIVFAVEGGTPLGHVDVDVVARVAGGSAAASGELYRLQQGSTLPIRFRIEQGIACTDTIDCVEVIVGSAGATVITPSEFAGVEIPAGALDAPVLVSIERVNVTLERCLPSDIIQAEGCYRYDTDPELSEVQESGLNEFNVDVVVGICIDPEVLELPEHHQYALHKFDPEQPDLGIVQLPSAAVDFLDCEGFTALADGVEGPILLRVARAGWERLGPLVRLLGPARAHAVNLGFGGLSKSFSNIGWARGLELELIAGPDQSGPTGSTLPIDPAVRVTATHWDPEELESAPTVDGIEVTFTFTDPEENVTTVSALTNSDGIASVPWVLGALPGTYALQVSGVTLNTVTLTATATDVEIDLAALADEATAAFIHAYGAGKLTGSNLDNVVTASALLSDEVYHSGTFTTRREFDRRAVSTSNGTLLQMYDRLQQARALLAHAGDVLHEAAIEAEINDIRVILLRINEGFAWLAFAENYCSGVPLVVFDDGELVIDAQHTTSEMFQAAVARFDEALALIELGGLPELAFDPASIALVGKARALLGLNDLAGASAAAALVPNGFGTVMQIDFPIEGEPFTNAFHALNAGQRRISVADGEGGNGLDYRSADDARLDVLPDELGGFNGMSAQHNLQAYALGSLLTSTARMPLASSVEARLIEAEVQLAAGNLAGALTQVNGVRATAGLPALTFIDLDGLFRERAFWMFATGRRLGDMRRLVRQYDRSPADVFPTGEYPLGDNYGTDMNFPLPLTESTGSLTCFDREA